MVRGLKQRPTLRRGEMCSFHLTILLGTIFKYTDLTQGLYPTLIVILVSIQMSPVEYHSTHSTGMQFTRNPAPVPPSMSQHVYKVGREYVSDSDSQVQSAVFMEISDAKMSLSME